MAEPLEKTAVSYDVSAMKFDGITSRLYMIFFPGPKRPVAHVARFVFIRKLIDILSVVVEACIVEDDRDVAHDGGVMKMNDVWKTEQRSYLESFLKHLPSAKRIVQIFDSQCCFVCETTVCLALHYFSALFIQHSLLRNCCRLE